MTIGSTAVGGVHVRVTRRLIGPVLVAWGHVPEPAPSRRSGAGSHAGSTDTCGFGADRRALSRRLLAALISELSPGSDTAVAQRCAHCGATDHGAPYAAGAPVAVSVSYAGPLVIAATSRAHARIGVDVETGPAGRDIGLTPLFAPGPAPDLAGWTRIEAVLKADGRGVRVAPGDVTFTEDGQDRIARLPGADDPIRVRTLDDGPAGHVVSAAWATARR